MPVVFSEAFTGTDGAAWSASNWTVDTTNASATIQSNQGRAAITTAGSGSNRVRAISTMSVQDDAEVLFSYNFNGAATNFTTDCFIHVWLRATGAWNGVQPVTSGYGITLRAGTAWVEINKFASSTFSTPASGDHASITTAKQWCRFRVQGTAIKVRVWDDGSGEPGTWDLEVTDSAVSGTGDFRLAVRSSATATTTNHVNFDAVAVDDLSGWSGRTAPDTIIGTNLTGALTAIDEDPDSPDANWLTVS